MKQLDSSEEVKQKKVNDILTLKLPCGVQWTPDNIPTAVKERLRGIA